MEQLKKYFYYFAGTLSEKLCVRGRCSVFGRRCPHSVFQQLQQFSEDLACSALADTDLAPVGGAGRPLEPAQLTSLATNTQEDYCCHNTTSPSYNSTFIEVNTSISISIFLTLLPSWLPGAGVRVFPQLARRAAAGGALRVDGLGARQLRARAAPHLQTVPRAGRRLQQRGESRYYRK